MAYIGHLLKDLEQNTDELINFLAQEREFNYHIARPEVMAFVQLKDNLSKRHAAIIQSIQRATYGKVLPEIPKPLKDKLLYLEDALKASDKRLSATIKAHNKLQNIIKNVIMKAQNPHAATYTQQGAKSAPPRRRLSTALKLNYCL